MANGTGIAGEEEYGGLWQGPIPTEIEAESQAYLNWLYQYLKSLYLAGGEGNLGNPDQGSAIWPWAGATEAYQMLANAQSLLEQGAWGTSYMYSLPFITEYMNLMQAGQKTFPAEEVMPEWATEGQVVVPSKLIRLPDGSYVDFNGIQVDIDTALVMIKDWLGTKDDDTLTSYEEGVLNQAINELAWEKQKYGTLSAADQASLQLAYDQLNQTRNEWLAGLKASPATFIERWYAEHLPVGTEMPSTYPWGEPAVGTQAWTQQQLGGTTTPYTGGQTSWAPQTTTPWTPQTTTPTTPATTTPSGLSYTAQNPWTTSSSIANWTGFEGMPTAENMSMAGYQIPSYQDYMSQYPNSSITPEAYYSEAGAYELAALYNPAYAYGAQQARVALTRGRITPTEYQQVKAANFVDSQGNPLVGVPYWEGVTATTHPTTGQLIWQGTNPSTGEPWSYASSSWGGSISPSGYTTGGGTSGSAGGVSTGGTSSGTSGSYLPASAWAEAVAGYESLK